MRKVWRVDSYLYTIEEIEVVPIARLYHWYRARIGEGSYLYCESEQEAKAILANQIENQISKLQTVLLTLS